MITSPVSPDIPVYCLHQIRPKSMESEFRSCGVCALRCIKQHGVDATKPASSHFSRPPCFLLPSVDISSDWTPIPKDFVEAHGESLHGTIRILDANTKEWSVEVGGRGKLLCFKGGWKNFVATTNLKRGDQMLFSLVSKTCFSVYAFNKLGVEVTPSSRVAPKCAPLVNGKRKRQEVESEPEADESEFSNSESSNNSDSEYKGSESDVESPQNPDAEIVPELNGGEILSTLKRRVTTKVTGSMKKVDSKPSHKKKVMTASSKDGLHIEPGSMTTTYESLRGEVTQAERDRTVEAAQSFETKHPSTHVLMKSSHVYRGFWLTIPGKFSREFLPHYKTEVVLQDIHGFEWPATWITNDHHTGLSGGWAAFSKDHCLEEGDMCIYEVIDSRDWKILVHIFRVVDVDLVPGTRGGWEKTYNIVYGAMMNRSGNTKNRSTIKRRSGKNVSISDESDADAGPLTKLYKLEKKSDSSSDITAEMIDVKTEIVSMGPVLKIAKVKLEPGVEPTLMRVKQEPGVPAICNTKKENPIYCGDVKPTRELKTSSNLSALPRGLICELSPNMEEATSVRSSASVVKPESVVIEALSNDVRRAWYPVLKMLGKRQNQKSPDLYDLLVTLVGCVVRTSESSCACEDGLGNWWVPRSQFSSDFANCYID